MAAASPLDSALRLSRSRSISTGSAGSVDLRWCPRCPRRTSSGLPPSVSLHYRTDADNPETLLDGWFPWLFVEPLGRGDDASQGYIRLLSTMRTSLAMYSRLYHQALKAQPESCTPRTEGTRIVYGLQTIGVIWHVFAMAEDDGQFVSVWLPRQDVDPSRWLPYGAAESRSRDT